MTIHIPQGGVGSRDKKEYFYKLVVILDLSLQLRWWQQEYRHMSQGAFEFLADALQIKKDSTFF
jgi:hypothetical protein